MIEPTAAIENLTNYQQQADMDGVLVTVSRQALEEVLDYLRTPPASQSDEALVEIVREVAELPDRTSPDDWPEAMLVTAEELQAIVGPILHAHEAAARADEREKALEEAAKYLDQFAPKLVESAAAIRALKGERHE